jgi:hypothetical protein
MPVPSSDFKKALARLSDKEKEALVLRAVRRDAELYDTFAYDRIHELFNVAVTGRLLNRSLVKALRAALQEAARARRVTKSKQLEIDLSMYALRLIFENYTGQFSSEYQGFFVGTARLATRLTQLIPKNLHEDLWLEYKPELDGFLTQLHGRSKSRELKFELPRDLVIPE